MIRILVFSLKNIKTIKSQGKYTKQAHMWAFAMQKINFLEYIGYNSDNSKPYLMHA
jgi:hypothetical protein